ncbi:hypothetical protein CASFOL_016829 [Castilleja foliolosa]|uniref:Uncharacterized protein n=1 Tax=Castilleja foliolosa TaxID=1961234 RepID=A0ABD3DA85_9LAMI
MLEAKRLNKVVVFETLISDPSPANLQCTRLDVHANEDASSCWIYVASGSRIYKLQIEMKDSSVGLGKESLLIPEHTQVLDSSLVSHCPHRSEIQSIVLTESESKDCSILGSVDSYGHLIVSPFDVSNTDGFTYSVSPRDYGVGEGGWAGLCFNPNQLSMFLLSYPSSLFFMDNSTLAVTEGSQLSIWDLRVKENGGCVHRITGSVGDILYAVSMSSTGNVAAGGADRTVTIYDPRRWCAVSRWLNCSKYEITGLTFSSVDPNYIYVQGVDYEVLCGEWRESKKAFSFRGDSNWLGFSKCGALVGDILAGWCDSGSIFVADVSDGVGSLETEEVA